MTPAEAAAFRAGLEAGAKVCEAPRSLQGWMETTPARIAAAIRALPVPNAESTCCRGLAPPMECRCERQHAEHYEDDLPNEAMREVGTAWLEQYGDEPDKAFVAAAVYRVMRQAKRTPDHYELAALRAARGQP